MEQKIATHQLTQVKTMIRKNYNTKYSIYDIIALDILIFILKPLKAGLHLPFPTSQTSYGYNKVPTLYRTFYSYSKLYALY